MKPHSVFALLLIAVSVLAVSLTGASSASRTDSDLTVSSSIDGTKLDDHMTLSGQVTWTASSSGTPNRIEFLIDGTSKWTDPAAPYQFGGDPAGKLDTTSLPTDTQVDGEGIPRRRKRPCDDPVGEGDDPQRQEPRRRRRPLRPPPSFVVASSIANGATLAGSLTWTATPSGTTVSSVDFLIDGTVKRTENTSPYVFNGDGSKLDTATLPNGAHTLAVQAHAADGRTATTSSAVTVANGPTPPPPPPPTPASFAVTSSVANGAALTGSAQLDRHAERSDVSQVDFLVDGASKWTEHVSPYQFNGDPDGKLDTTTLSDGAHTLAVKAYASDGRTADVTSSVTVKNAPATAAPFVRHLEHRQRRDAQRLRRAGPPHPSGRHGQQGRVPRSTGRPSRPTGRAVPVRRRRRAARHHDARERPRTLAVTRPTEPAA